MQERKEKRGRERELEEGERVEWKIKQNGKNRATIALEGMED